MENARTLTVIVAPPGVLRDSLQVVIEASGKIEIVGTGDDWAYGLKTITDLAPGLVVVDLDGFGDRVCWQALRQFKTEWPQIQCCIVVHTLEQESQARAAGVKIVLHAGFSTKTFFDAIAE